jgi:hypothetical protein
MASCRFAAMLRGKGWSSVACFFLAAFCMARVIGSMIRLPNQTWRRLNRIGRAWSRIPSAICLFAVAVLAVEPFISSQSLKLRKTISDSTAASVVGGAVASQLQKNIQPIMSKVTLASLLSFFVLQALVYIWCLAKISEIRRQPVGARMKLRLLENEEHLFDAGLYLGLVGTIISLIVFSLGLVKPSLMAAYSSTSFGIIFVSILKIFHIRPLRRTLIMESEPKS